MLELAQLASAAVPGSQLGFEEDAAVADTALDYLAQLRRVLALVPGEALGHAIRLVLEARAKGKRVYVMGNGGSSATASHFVCDLMKTARVDGFDPVRAFALTDNTPLLTAWANDQAYKDTFAEQVTALVEPGDLVIGISASGNSPNIIAGLHAANLQGAHTIGMVGFEGGRARDVVDVAIHIESHDYGLVEDTHSALTHAIATAVRRVLEADAALVRLAAVVD